MLVSLIICCCCLVPQPVDGSVIFWEGGLLVRPIEKHTGSRYTHVAVILYTPDPTVYEATWPRVRRMPLNDYIKWLEYQQTKHPDLKWYLRQPVAPYTQEQLTSMKKYAKAQLGRPYMLKGWWKNREVKGIFCSQYVANCLEKSQRIKSANYKESPGSLYKKLKGVYK
jgi:hypothetical protein